MRVNPSLNNTSVDQLRSTGDSSRGTSKSPGAASAVGEVASFSRSPELNGYLAALKDLPDIRADILATVQAKITAGDFQTQAAYAEAATNLDDAANL